MTGVFYVTDITIVLVDNCSLLNIANADISLKS